jgi:protoheme IX farnesyltransferase
MHSSATTSSPSHAQADIFRWRAFFELTKPRLSMMSVATAVLGYFAAGPRLELATFWGLLAGTTLAAFGAAALNQWWEREADALMERTASRPLAQGQLSPSAALNFGLAMSAIGVGVLWSLTGVWPAVLAALTILLYVLAYTPLKMKTPWATEMGAIPGALPPLIGWTAAGAGFSLMGWALFAVLFAWQIPHFMAISWNYREDYRKAGFQMLSVRDASGDRVARSALVWSILLVAVSLYPLTAAHINWCLGLATALLGAAMLTTAVQFRWGADRRLAARRLFFVTLFYLPLYLVALIVDQYLV